MKTPVSLPYAFDALQPVLDAQTLELHSAKHYKAYVDGYNNAMQKMITARENGDYAAIKHLKREIAFHGSGALLHELYFENMTPAQTQPSASLMTAIETTFGSFENCIKEFQAAGAVVEASGWVLLVANDKNELEILTCEKHQDLALWNTRVLLACDVWEHAYYLSYQNRRAEYLDKFCQVINWDVVSQRFAKV